MSAVDPSDGARIPALDGVRAVAVVLVILFHLQIPGFRGGFLGVDIFFVLSGFLITGLLLGEVETSDKISLVRFWSRRARRLIPALVLVLIAVALIGITGTPGEREALRFDLLATAGYVANWRFIDTSSYFSSTGLESPLVHTWSLAVEEQFYLLWPLLIWIVALRPGRRRGRVALAAAVIAAVSGAFLWTWWEPGAPERAYMGTDARMLEPLIGAFGAAMLSGRVRARVHRLGPILVILGALVLTISVATTDGVDPGYYAGGAAVLSVGALLLIGPLAIGAGGRLGRVLSMDVIVWVGTISYGLYLWHWPVATYLGARDLPGLPASGASKAAAWLVTVAAAAVSYRLVEQPLRARARGTGGDLATRRSSVRTLIGMGAALVLVSIVSVGATSTSAAGSAAHVVMLTGDSVPLRLRVALERRAASSDVRFLPAAFGACPVTGETPVWADGVQIHFEPCPVEIPVIQDGIVDETDPDVVVWWDRWSVAGFRTEDGVLQSGSEGFWEHRRRALAMAVTRLSSRGALVILVGVEPPGISWDSVCAARPVECRWRQFLIRRADGVVATWNEELARYALDHPDRAVYLDLSRHFCGDARVPCDDRIGGIPARPDGIHYEGAGAEAAADVLWRQIAIALGVPA